MADDRADRAVVDGSRGLRIEERRLQDGRGEIQRILQRQINGVNGLRRHGPLMTVDGLADARDLHVEIPHRGPPRIAEGVIGSNFVGGVVLPGFGIADADVERIQLGVSFGARAGGEPGESVEPFV